MTALKVFAVVLLVFFLLGQIRLGVALRCDEEGLRVWARAGLARLTLLRYPLLPPPPRRPGGAKPKKKPKKKPDEKPKPQPAKPSLGARLDLVQALLPVALDALGSFHRKLVVDRLELQLHVGAEDPADAAMAYGSANAVLGALWQRMVTALHIKDGRAHIDVDFERHAATVYAHAETSMKVGQLAGLGIFFGLRALKTFLAYRRGRKKLLPQASA